MSIHLCYCINLIVNAKIIQVSLTNPDEIEFDQQKPVGFTPFGSFPTGGTKFEQNQI